MRVIKVFCDSCKTEIKYNIINDDYGDFCTLLCRANYINKLALNDLPNVENGRKNFNR